MSFSEGCIVSVSLGLTLFGAYILNCIVKYVKNKPPFQQSMLDGVQIQMFNLWMIEYIMLLLTFSLMILEIKSFVLSMMIGFGVYAIMIANSVHLVICVLTRIGLVYHQATLEAIQEKRFRLFARYVSTKHKLVQCYLPT